MKQEGGGPPASRAAPRAGRGGPTSSRSGCGEDSHSVSAHKNLLVFIGNGHPGPRWCNRSRTEIANLWRKKITPGDSKVGGSGVTLKSSSSRPGTHACLFRNRHSRGCLPTGPTCVNQAPSSQCLRQRIWGKQKLRSDLSPCPSLGGRPVRPDCTSDTSGDRTEPGKGRWWDAHFCVHVGSGHCCLADLPWEGMGPGLGPHLGVCTCQLPSRQAWGLESDLQVMQSLSWPRPSCASQGPTDCRETSGSGWQSHRMKEPGPPELHQRCDRSKK